MARMSRSLQIHPDRVEYVKQKFRTAMETQQELANALMLSRDTVNAFLNGKKVDRINFLELATRLNLDPEELIVPNTQNTSTAPTELENRSEKLISLDNTQIVRKGEIFLTELSDTYSDCFEKAVICTAQQLSCTPAVLREKMMEDAGFLSAVKDIATSLFEEYLRVNSLDIFLGNR